MNSVLTSQRISDLLASLTADKQQSFLSEWMSHIQEKGEHICYDITSISSYAQMNPYVKYGYNRDHESLPQINLGMLFSQKSFLPAYFFRAPGNISDVTTLPNTLKSLKLMKIKSVNYVMDKGFYSEKNIDVLLSHRAKFTQAVPIHNRWVQEAIDEIHSEILNPKYYHEIGKKVLYIHSKKYMWKGRRCYLHVYYNDRKRAQAMEIFNKNLIAYKQEVESNQRCLAHEKMYERFLVIKQTPKRGLKVSYNEAAIEQYRKHYAGFQVLLSNAIQDPVEALKVYRNKDVVEKSFNDLKNNLDMKRLRMHSTQTTDGRIFVQFIALILLSYLRNEMRNTKLNKRYSAQDLLHEMETLTQINYSGSYASIITEQTKAQRKIMQALNIDFPSDQ